jgi:hypothetical protein
MRLSRVAKDGDEGSLAICSASRIAARVVRFVIPREIVKGIACDLTAWRRKILNAVEMDMPRSSNSFSASHLTLASILTVKFAVDIVYLQLKTHAL